MSVHAGTALQSSGAQTFQQPSTGFFTVYEQTFPYLFVLPDSRRSGIIGNGGLCRMPEWIISHAMWKDIFVVAVPLGEKVLRPVLVYLFLVVLLRIFGKRELAQLNPFDLGVLLSLWNPGQNAITVNE